MPAPDSSEHDEFRDLYDERTLARIEAQPRLRGPVVVDGTGPLARRGLARRTAGPILAAALLAVGDVLDPAGRRPEVVDFDPEVPDEEGQLVTFVHVPGDPRASRLIVRPWLLAG
ncbi:MAG: hypothetical protein MUF83_14505 [Acidimicrobiales bacterium]|jgi:hypothetical protein|nr:hypothetical protein [Acidimicrobiales bacterium]